MNALIAEFIGTAVLILLGGGVVANVVLKDTKGHNAGWMVISTGWALAVFTGVIIAGPYSGAHLNPAVTLANLILNKMTLMLGMQYILMQVLGAMFGSFVVWCMYKDHFAQTDDAGAKEAVFCTRPAIFNPKINLTSEIVGTFVLIFSILHFTNPTTHQGETFGLGSIGALPVGFIVWAIGLSLGGTTGYAINPARDLGPRIVHALLPIKNKKSFHIAYAWIPVVGPLIGSAIATILYLYITT
jgi:glycerol uptake facilitator protein